MSIETATLQFARTLLRGPWTVDGLAHRARQLLEPTPRGRSGEWIVKLARELVLVFDPRQPRPLIEVLYKVLVQDRYWRGYVKQRRKNHGKLCIRPEKIPPPMMMPAAGRAESWAVPPFTTPGVLAEWLGLTCVELDWFADCAGRLSHAPDGPLRHYRYRWIAKRSGGMRLLEMPKWRLKDIQRQLLENILDEIPPHAAAHAYRRGRSIASYLAPHAGQDMVIHFDLCDFFTSVRWPTVHALFRTAGYPEDVARLLTGLCLNVTPPDVIRKSGLDIDPYNSSRAFALRLAHLPQGAPTSPALANLAAYRLDCRLSGLAEKMNLQYTRYADDIVFSGTWPKTSGTIRFQTLVRTILANEGFSMHGRKTRIMTSATHQSVSGVTLNEHLNLPRDDYDQLKALLHNCSRFGPASQNRTSHPHFRDHLLGRIAYCALINPIRGEKLKSLFEKIDWRPCQIG